MYNGGILNLGEFNKPHMIAKIAHEKKLCESYTFQRTLSSDRYNQVIHPHWDYYCYRSPFAGTNI